MDIDALRLANQAFSTDRFDRFAFNPFARASNEYYSDPRELSRQKSLSDNVYENGDQLGLGGDTQNQNAPPTNESGVQYGDGILSGLQTSNTASLQGMRGGLLGQLMSETGLTQAQTNFAGNQAIGKAVGAMFGPYGAAAYGIARALGFNPAQGISEAINYTGTPGYEGGFFGTPGIGSGITNTQVGAPVSNQSVYSGYYSSPLTSDPLGVSNVSLNAMSSNDSNYGGISGGSSNGEGYSSGDNSYGGSSGNE